jgi:hypothetical protein
MELTDAQQRTALAHLKQRLDTPRCPTCGASNMRLQPHLYPPPTPMDAHDADDDGTTSSDPEPLSGPVVHVVCGFCGLVMTFSARVMGLLDADQQQQE